MAQVEFARVMIDQGPLEYLKLAIFYASFLVFPAAALLIWLMVKRLRRRRIDAAIGLAVLAVFAYARFVEPRILLTVEHERELPRCFPEAGAARIAVLSDIHLGLFPHAMPVARIAAAVERTKPDLVFIAGDFTDHLGPNEYLKAYGPLAGISAPVYAVLGNHDLGLPGPDVRRPLTAALETLGVDVIDNEKMTITVRGDAVEIVGLSDLWEGLADRTLIEGVHPRPRFVLTHNPSMVGKIERPHQISDLMISGHTHGGQINLPLLTCALVYACETKRYGFKEAPRGLIFVTSGVGMVGLPVRFNVPPRIDVLDVSWRRCR